MYMYHPTYCNVCKYMYNTCTYNMTTLLDVVTGVEAILLLA